MKIKVKGKRRKKGAARGNELASTSHRTKFTYCFLFALFSAEL